MTQKPRIAVAGFQHESNSFSPFGATWHDFEIADGWPELTRGSALLDVFTPLNIPLGGFLSSGDFEFVPIAWSSAEPSGPVSDDAFARMAQIICDGLRTAGPLDGIYLDLHGAMVTESHEDGEGELLKRIRSIVGDTVPVVVSLDMHANITEEMVALADAMTIYRTYPHVDMADAGARCVPLMERLITGKKIFKAYRKLPYLIPLSAQCTEMEPFRSIYGRLPTYMHGNILSVDIASGFPAADIFECGPSVLAYARDQASADRCADEILTLLMEAEHAFRNDLVSVPEAVAIAMANASGKPIVLADVQDNPGAGGTSDTTTILQALVDAGARRAAVSVLWDPEAAKIAHEAGEGAEIELQLGGRYGYDARSFRTRFHVEQISDGQIKGNGAIVGGAIMSLGPMAQLRVAGTDIRVVVSSVRYQCLDQMLFRALGIEPQDQSILVVKSTIHFRADFEPIASRILLVESPGAHSCRPNLSKYLSLRPGLRVVG